MGDLLGGFAKGIGSGMSMVQRKQLMDAYLGRTGKKETTTPGQEGDLSTIMANIRSLYQPSGGNYEYTGPVQVGGAGDPSMIGTVPGEMYGGMFKSPEEFQAAAAGGQVGNISPLAMLIAQAQNPWKKYLR